MASSPWFARRTCGTSHTSTSLGTLFLPTRWPPYDPSAVRFLPCHNTAGGVAMSDREALIRSIVESPDEDAPRLVFADWLEENGDADWAAFIRLQCGYAAASGDRLDALTESSSRWADRLPS